MILAYITSSANPIPVFYEAFWSSQFILSLFRVPENKQAAREVKAISLI